MTKAEEIGLRHGIIEGFSIHSNSKIAKEKFNIAMFEYGRYCAKEAWKQALLKEPYISFSSWWIDFCDANEEVGEVTE